MSWDDAVRPDEMDRLKPNQILLNSDQLKVYDTGQLSTHAAAGGALVAARDSETWEFKATGNVAFNGVSESGDFLGNGYQLTYVRLKNQLLLRGDGRTPAYLQRAPKVAGDSLFKAYVESVVINPESLEISELRLAAGGIEVQPGGASGSTLNSGTMMNPGSMGKSGQPSRLQETNPSPTSVPNPRQNFFDRGSRSP
jgi:hypothetical protein